MNKDRELYDWDSRPRMSQEQVALRMGISRCAVSRSEVEALRKIAAGLARFERDIMVKRYRLSKRPHERSAR